MRKIQFDFAPLVPFFWAILLLLIPLRWLFACAFAALVHELCHIFALKLFRSDIFRIHIGVLGAQIETAPLDPVRELVCAAAGPLGSLALIAVRRIAPEIAICAFFQAAYNLLPIAPMDGGRILRCAFALILPPKYATSASRICEYSILFLLIAVGLWASIRMKLGIFPLFFAILFCLRIHPIKIPCKTRSKRLQ